MTETPSGANPDPLIRDMELEDIPRVFRLGERLFTADRWPVLYRTWDEYELVNLYGAAGATCLVAMLDTRLVGFVLGSLVEKRNSPWTYGYLQWIGVDPGAKGQGIGSQLIEELTLRFIEQGARMMIVDTDPENERAVRLFRRAGFEKEQPHLFLSRNLVHESIYQRNRNG